MKTAALALAAMMLAACTTDSYDAGEGPNSLLTADFVEARTNADCAIVSLITDAGETLELSNPAAPEWAGRPDTLYRAVAYYDRSASQTVRLRSIGRVTTLQPVALKPDETVYTDPLRLESAWLSQSGKYINMGIYLMIGDTDDSEARHTVALIADSIAPAADGRDTLCLTFFHNQGGVPEHYSQKYYISVPASSIFCPVAAITVNTYDGPLRRVFDVR